MRATLVNSNFTEQIIPNFMINFEAGMLSLAAVARGRGHQIRLVNLFQLLAQGKLPGDAGFCEQAAEYICRDNAEVYGFNSRCDTYPIVLNIARKCKQLAPGAVVVIGGPQASFTDTQTLDNFPFVDFIVRGEGEETFSELLDCLQKRADPAIVAGISYRRDGKTVRNVERGLIADLDALPLPAYDLIDDYAPSRKEIECGWAYISIGRGCPYSCTFCSTGSFWKRRYRMRSPGHIIREITLLRGKYGIRRFYLGHDNFLTNKKDIERLCDALIEYGGGIRWTCSSRIDCQDSRLLEKMAASGCERIFFGVESGSARIQKAIKKDIDLSAVRRVISECAGSGISAVLSFIVGFPGESETDIDDTLELALESRLSSNCHSYIRPLTLIAGTELHAAAAKGLKLRDTWSRLYLIGPLIKRTAWSRRLLSAYPSMFSNFYSLKLEHMSWDAPHEAVTLFSALMGAYPVSLYLAMKEFALRPMELMRRFRRYAKVAAPPDVIVRFPGFLKKLCGGDSSNTYRWMLPVLRAEETNCLRVRRAAAGKRRP